MGKMEMTITPSLQEVMLKQGFPQSLKVIDKCWWLFSPAGEQDRSRGQEGLGVSAVGTPGVHTWEDKDEAGGQASDDWDDLADVRDEERQQQGEQEPDQRLKHSPPPLPAHVFLHRHALVAQPQAFDHRPAHKERGSEAYLLTVPPPLQPWSQTPNWMDCR